MTLPDGRTFVGRVTERMNMGDTFMLLPEAQQ